MTPEEVFALLRRLAQAELLEQQLSAALQRIAELEAELAAKAGAS